MQPIAKSTNATEFGQNLTVKTKDASSQLVEKMKTLTVDIFDVPLDQAAREAMDRLLRLYEQDRLILLELVSELPDLRHAVGLVSFDSLHRGGIRGFIRHRKDKATTRDVNRRAFFVEHLAKV